jgi:hypothetical protein
VARSGEEMQSQCFKLTREAFQLLQIAGSPPEQVRRLANEEVDLDSLGKLVDCEFVEFSDGRLVLLTRGREFLQGCSRHQDGSASIDDDLLSPPKLKPREFDGDRGIQN